MKVSHSTCSYGPAKPRPPEAKPLPARQSYVVGFLFDVHREMVVLIEKQKPEWQRGLLNGVGGKVESGENPYAAMVREFEEETSLHIPDWDLVCELRGEWGNLFVYKAHAIHPEAARTMESEEVGCYIIRYIMQSERVVPNLRWLICMALTIGRGEHACSFTITEHDRPQTHLLKPV